MCLSHYVCFDCRKGFKQEPQHNRSEAPKCPQCSSPMVLFNTRFRVPPKNNLNQWRKVRLFHQNGLDWVAGKNLRDAREIIDQRKDRLATPHRFSPQEYYYFSVKRKKALRKAKAEKAKR